MPIPRLGSLYLATLLTAGACAVGCASNGSSSGSGGSSATGGSSGSGGAVGSGGTTATGGSSGSGGATATGGATGSGGATATGGVTSTGGVTATGGATGSGGSVGSGGKGGISSGGTGAGGKAAGTGGAGGAAPKFSFFMTSLAALTRLSRAAGATNDLGFGGDLRYGESGAGAGLRGADKICTEIAEASLPGAGKKTWHAFLSTVDGPVHAKDRIGTGPWYDRKGRLVASTLAQMLMQRPGDADTAIKDDLPNEDGIPNHNPDLTGKVDNHDVLTGTNTQGMLYAADKHRTCDDWTSKAGTGAGGASGGGGTSGGMGRGAGPWCGHSWPAGSGMNWMSALAEGGCEPGINLQEMGGPMPGVYTVGTGGGYGAFYCFALTP